MSTYSTENIGAVLPLIRQRASQTRLGVEDQEDLTQEVVIGMLTSRSEDQETLLKDLDDSFRKSLSRISSQLGNRLSLCYLSLLPLE